MLKKLTASLIAATLLFNTVAAMEIIDWDALNSETPRAYETQEEIEVPTFFSFTGEVMEIETHYSDNEYEPEWHLLHLDGDYGPAVFVVDFNTFVLGDDIEIGDTITGYYLTDRPMILIWPPQFTVSVIVNGAFDNVHVDRFDDELTSFDNFLRLNLDDDTEIVLQDGTPFNFEYGDLTNRKLVVVYGVATRSIPAITTPDLVVVLFESFVTLPDFVEVNGDSSDNVIILPPATPLEDTETSAFDPIDWSQYDIIVNGVGLPGVNVQTVGDWIFPTHVPLRPVAEALGAYIGWNAATREVTVDGINGLISFRVGSMDFTVNGEVITLPLASVVINDRTYVPTRFFQDVFGMNNAYFEGGHVVINNEEPMR